MNPFIRDAIEYQKGAAAGAKISMQLLFALIDGNTVDHLGRPMSDDAMADVVRINQRWQAVHHRAALWCMENASAGEARDRTVECGHTRVKVRLWTGGPVFICTDCGEGVEA